MAPASYEYAVHRIAAQTFLDMRPEEIFQKTATVRTDPAPVQFRTILQNLRIHWPPVLEHGHPFRMFFSYDFIDVEAEIGNKFHRPLDRLRRSLSEHVETQSRMSLSGTGVEVGIAYAFLPKK